MPKAFSEAEKDAIRSSLADAALRHFERTGIRAARVDDICHDVGIAKGSFYAFFPSKEELFMAIVGAREAQHRTDMLAYIDGSKGSAAVRARGFFDLILRKIEDDPILNLVVANNEAPHLLRKLGPERFARAQQEDRDFARDASRRWKKVTGTAIDAADLLSLMTITLSVATQRRQMTADQYEPAIKLLRDLFAARLTEHTK